MVNNYFRIFLISPYQKNNFSEITVTIEKKPGQDVEPLIVAKPGVKPITHLFTINVVGKVPDMSPILSKIIHILFTKKVFPIGTVRDIFQTFGKSKPMQHKVNTLKN